MTKYLGLPVNASATGQGVDNLILWVHVLMAALFIGWLTYFLYTLFRFRRSRNARADYVGVRNHSSSYLEGFVAIFEAVLLIGFAIPIWATVVADFPDEEKSTVIQVVGEQFFWHARYPGYDGEFGAQNIAYASAENPFGLAPDDPKGMDDFAVRNEIYVPVGKPVIFHISSLDVIHSVAIKPMRVTQDAIPGLTIPAWFTPSKIGVYQITCAQLCGSGHYAMKGHLHVVSQEEYDVWFSGEVARAMSARGAVPDYE